LFFLDDVTNAHEDFENVARFDAFAKGGKLDFHVGILLSEANEF
jgi:hypothetical protein